VKRIGLLLLSVALLIPVAGCGEKQAPYIRQALVYGSGNYTSINPALYEHGEINLLLFAGLTRHDKDNQVIEGLAQSWTYDEETLTYVFTLRDGLTFHDGGSLTSADVKFTLDVIMDPANGSENASNFEEISSIETPDDLTVIITLSAPCVAMPDYLTIGILPRHLYLDQDVTTSWVNRHPIGAGPYQLQQWDMGQWILMSAFDDYYLGAPKIEQVLFKIVDDYSARALQMRVEEFTLTQVQPRDAQEFIGNPRFAVYDMDTADYRGILYNFNNQFWKDHPELPSALSYAIDREAIVRSILLGKGEAAWSPLQKGPYANEDIEKYVYDPEIALLLLRGHGWEKGSDGYLTKDGAQLTFTISAPSSDPVRVDMASIAAQNLQDIGVNASVDVVARADWANQYAYLIGWGSPFDPDDHTYKVFGTSQGANYSGYSDADVDRLLSAARSTEDPDLRLELYRQFQEALALDPAYTFIAYIDAVYVAQSSLHGITPDTVLGHHGVGIFWNVHEWTLG